MLKSRKHLFSLPEGLHYLNGAYMSPLSRHVEEAGIQGVRSKCIPSLIEPPDFFEPADRLREKFARLINVSEANRIAVIPAVSYGLSVTARNLKFSPEQNIVVLFEQFPSNVYTWRRLCDETGAELRTILPPAEKKNRGAVWNERILDAIDDATALVTLGPVHWADGTLFDLERIGRKARSVGAVFVVDGTQAVGAMPFDCEKIQPDAVVCAGYKWLLGPYGLGVAYFGPRYDNGVPLEENWICRRGSENFSGLVAYEPNYQPGAVRYDVGERSNFALVPMLSAGLDHVLEWTPEAVQAYCRELTRDLLSELSDLGYIIENENSRSHHLFGIRLPEDLDREQVQIALKRRNISVSMRGNAIRVSPNVYNEPADMEALHEVLQSFRR